LRRCLAALVADAESLVAAHEKALRVLATSSRAEDSAPAAGTQVRSAGAEQVPFPQMPFSVFAPMLQMARLGTRTWLEAADRSRAFWLDATASWLPHSLPGRDGKTIASGARRGGETSSPRE
jgi:hypothetical protein